ncbi:MAG: DNA cytosine methyltransferase [Anaerolineae bacterium]|nr:DNA cytosine methyltransferase [Anaerolineae bacterium]
MTISINPLAKNIAVDVFCGVGGLTYGLAREGINVVAGIDADSTCRFAYERNNPDARFIEGDVQSLPVSEIEQLYGAGAVRILAGCAPCQPFSRYTQRYAKNEDSADQKWALVSRFAEIIVSVSPHIVTMENVPELTKHAVFEDFVRTLQKAGYFVSHSTVQCADYGVPQSRLRLVLLASKLGKIEFLPPTHKGKHKTVADAIGRLERIDAGMQSSRDRLHRASGLSALNLRRIMNTPEGGSWRNWPKELLLECHKKESGKSFGSIYGRMWWNKPSPTITTEFHGLGSGRFGHPVQHRAISIREAALLQSFPKSYKFVPPRESYSIDAVARHIGNAVPVRLGQIIGRSINKHLSEHSHSDRET